MTDDLERYAGLKHQIPTKAALRTLLRAMCKARDSGDNARFTDLRGQVIALHMRLAVNMARRHKGAPLEDRVQMAVMGMIKACDTFDISRGFAFSTYAMWWARSSIQRAIRDTESAVRVPAGLQEKVARVRRAEAVHQAKHGTAPTPQQAASLARLTEAQAARALVSQNNSATSLETVVCPADGLRNCDVVLGDLLVDPGENPEEALLRGERETLARGLFDCLTPRERVIIRARFCSPGERPTLNVIGDRLGITRERVRQIQNEALAKMKAFSERGGRR